MAASNESGGLWPVHLKPKDDELLSSWLVRLACAYGQKLHSFCSRAWPRKQIWNRDIDKSADAEMIEVLSTKTGTSVERVWATTLSAYENVLYERHNRFGPTSWIMPIGVYHRTRRLFGLQYCPLCLTDDKEPYFRRKWRLAFMVFCEKHHILLHDRCPDCGTAVNFHRDELGDYRKLVADTLTCCHLCRFELRSVDNCFNTYASHKEWELSTMLLRAMNSGYVRLGESVVTHPQLFFAGLRQLMKIVAMRNQRIDKLRRAIGEELGLEIYSPPVSSPIPDVQEMSIIARRQLLTAVGFLLEEWPRRFIELSRKYGVWSSLWLRHLEPPARANTLPTPFWLWSVIHENLYRARYCPSDEEMKAAIEYLKRSGKVASKSALARLLGLAIVRRI